LAFWLQFLALSLLRFDTAESEGEDEDEGEGDATPGTSRVGRLVNRELPRSKD
jgi:hypothetical protein